ncbi:MAG: hypothetical protein C4520_18715 [Candidatus Abyssobacteria bacterium SURF_5]|uniref:Protein kinase domain-containing protein n=1 Tax=Abyssobacteria bacterium (strain SURF_5) TaxID=2093360 RepID=A0A3A4N8F5_ABYX5|nr:MAG: hypothetical protein C4520_18715 [Candidatus Abyssubacteria bacterium SURF_5]
MDAQTDLRNAVEQYLGACPSKIIIHRELGDFFAINRGDVVVLDGRYYVVSGIARERSFGLDDEPKHWVKYAFEVPTGKRKIIKLVFQEQFTLKYGEYRIRCFRSPLKEGYALEHVRGNPYFMQGCTITTSANEHVRVIDHIGGRTLLDEVEYFNGPHEAYFNQALPSLLRLFLPSLTALHELHDAGIRHGDVRSDHLILDNESKKLRWIDFDYDFVFDEKPFALDLFGIGNILSELVGQGARTLHNLARRVPPIEALERLEENDFSVVENTRLMNWRKLYPYIPPKLNQVLMHFSHGAELFYESIPEIVEDIGDAIMSLPPAHFEKQQQIKGVK